MSAVAESAPFLGEYWSWFQVNCSARGYLHKKWKKWLGREPRSPYPDLGLVTSASRPPREDMSNLNHPCYHKDFSSVKLSPQWSSCEVYFYFFVTSTTILFLRLKEFYFFQTVLSGGIFYMWNNFSEEMCPPHPETCTGKQVQPTSTGISSLQRQRKMCSKSPLWPLTAAGSLCVCS